MMSICEKIQGEISSCWDRDFFSKSRLYHMLNLIKHNLDITIWDYPLDPNAISSMFSNFIDIKYNLFDSQKLGGFILKNELPNKSCIVINTAKPKLSQQFTLAHELIHFFMHPNNQQYICETLKVNGHPYEWQANEGSAELLLPYKMVIPHIAQLYIDAIRNHDMDSLSLIPDAIATEYKVSNQVAQFRIKSLTYEICQFIEGSPIEEIQILSRSKREKLKIEQCSVIGSIYKVLNKEQELFYSAYQESAITQENYNEMSNKVELLRNEWLYNF